MRHIVEGWIALVAAFHRCAGQPIEAKPIELTYGDAQHAMRKLRQDLLAEEFKEYLDAEVDNDIVEIADALGDMVYVICGTALAYGIPLDRVFREIHRSNMTKADPADGQVRRRADGKILKPPTYSPPDVRGILEAAKQGSFRCLNLDQDCTYYATGACDCTPNR